MYVNQIWSQYEVVCHQSPLPFVWEAWASLGCCPVLASIIEQNHDEHGMILPLEVAPYKVAIVATNTKDENIMDYANKLHDELESLNIDTILDDRDERPGVKFNDMDLIGVPIRVTVGKKLSDGLVEIKLRNSDSFVEVKTDNVIEEIKKLTKNK